MMSMTDFEAMKGVEGTFGRHVYLTEEDLPQKLRRFYRKPDDGFFAWFHHPLYVTMLPTMSPIPLDELIDRKRRSAEKALEEGKASRYVFAHERGYRMGKLMELAEEGFFDGTTRREVEFWKLASEVWTDAEFDEDDPCWSELMDCGVANRWAMTEGKDRRALRAMGDFVRVYRGVQSWSETGALEYAHTGWSWTFSPKTARFFARRWLNDGKEPFVIRADVPKDLVQAYLTGRGEREVLIAPGEADGHPIRVQRVSRKHEPRGKPSAEADEEWSDG